MVNIKGFPLLHEEECKEMFSADMSFSGYYFMKPIYKWLPDFSDLDDEEKAKYIPEAVQNCMHLSNEVKTQLMASLDEILSIQTVSEQ